jgi:integrase
MPPPQGRSRPLKWQDVDLQEGALYVRQSRTPGRRAVPMTNRGLNTPREWMKITGPDFSPFLFAIPQKHDVSVRKT